MFIVNISYKTTVDKIETHLSEHREYLSRCYNKDRLIFSGPKNPRDGGVLLSQLSDKEELLAMLAEDPFVIHDLVEYKVIEVQPTMYHYAFDSFIREVSTC